VFGDDDCRGGWLPREVALHVTPVSYQRMSFTLVGSTPI
jgi:hypothetical protein